MGPVREDPPQSQPSAAARLLFSLALRLYPRQIRARFGADMRQFFIDDYRELGGVASGKTRASFYLRTYMRLVWNGFGARTETLRMGSRNRRQSVGSVGGRGGERTGHTPMSIAPRSQFGFGEGLSGLARTLRHAGRSLARSPGFTLTSVLTLGIGIGACTLIFSVVYPVLVSPLPYPDAEELVVLFEVRLGEDGERGWASPLTFRDWQERSVHFEGIVSYRLNIYNWTGDGEPAMLRGWAVSAGYFPLMGTEMTLGRGFTEEEDQPGGERVVVVSSAFWRQQLGADPAVLGKTMTLDGEPFTIVGVAGPQIDFPYRAEYWIPAAMDYSLEYRDFRYLGVIARLRDGSSMEDARTEMARISQEVEAENPDTNEGWGAEVQSLKEFQVGYFQPYLIGLSVAVGILLVIALGNITNLYIARNAGRQSEAAVRRALGASRGALARLFVTETMVLSLIGGALGVVVAFSGAEALRATALLSLPRLEELTVDARCLIFALGISVAVGVVLGAASVLISGSQNLSQSLRAGGPGGMAPAGTHRLRELVLTTQVGLALTLLIGAALLSRSLFGLGRIDVGFSPDDLYAFSFDLPSGTYEEPQLIGEFYREAMAQIQAIPGVQAAGAVTPMPMEMGSVPGSWTLPAEVASPGDQVAMAHMRTATPGYFEAMRIRLLAGRYFEDMDRAESEQVALVNRAFVERYLVGHDPVGMRVSPGDPGDEEMEWMTIVGVVGNVQFRNLTAEAEPEIYIPVQQFPSGWGHLVVRATGSQEAVATAVAEAVHRVDPTLPLTDVNTGDEIIGRQLRTSRLYTTLTAFFALTATALSVVGILGVLSIVVAQRMREIGLRIVLGAQAASIWGFTVSRGMRPVLIGLFLGLVVSLAGTRFLESQIYGVSTLDPLAFLLPTLGFATAGMLACLIPGARASSTDPVKLLRSE
jgi:putative ABC transport system permease protein